jgi:chaperonin GroES
VKVNPISEDRMSLQPLEDRIVVRSSEAESTTASGLVIPDTAQEKPQQGEVIAVGPGLRSHNGHLVPMEIAVGYVFVYTNYGATENTNDGEDLLIHNARDVLAKIG